MPTTDPLFTFLNQQLDNTTDPDEIWVIVDAFNNIGGNDFKNLLRDIVNKVSINQTKRTNLLNIINTKSVQELKNGIRDAVERLEKLIDNNPILSSGVAGLIASEEVVEAVTSYQEEVQSRNICVDEDAPYTVINPDVFEVEVEPPISIIKDLYEFSYRQRYVNIESTGEISSYLQTGTAEGNISVEQLRAKTGNFWYELKERYSKLLPVVNGAKDFPALSNQNFSSIKEYIDSAANKTKQIDVNQTFKSINLSDPDVSSFIETVRADLESIDLDYSEKTDFVFDIKKALNKKQIKLLSKSDLSLKEWISIEVENDYNFYVSSFEKLLNSSEINITAKMLPNFYILLTDNFRESKNLMNLEKAVVGEINSRDYTDNFQHRNLMSLSGALNIDASNDEYYDIFSIDFPNASQSQKSFVNNKMSNIVFSNEEYLLYKEFEHKKENVPFYIKVKFDTEGYGPISNILKETQITDLLVSYVATKEYSERAPRKTYKVSSLDYSEKTRDLELYSYDMRKSIEEIVAGYNFNNTHITYLGLLESKIENVNKTIISEESYSEYVLSHFLIDQFIHDYKMQNGRTFKEIIEGKRCYEETLFYRIDKYERDQITGQKQKIQSFYLPNVENQQELSFIDSQIKYETDYIYKIYTYKAVLGNKYLYISDWGTSKQTTIKNVPSFHIIETEFGEVDGIVTDKPPPPPEVQVIPFKDRADKALFLFNPSTVEYKLYPIIIDEREELQYDMIRRSQQLELEEKIKFGGDDKTEEYYVYRIEKHPTSYEDFKNNVHKTLQTLNNVTTAEFLEDLEPNKKYYYIFRSIDVHDYISNPTEVFMVQIIEDNGLSFLRVEVVPFIKKEFKKAEKNVRRFLHIKPSDIQLSALYSDEEVDEKIKEHVWGKTFKIRLKSKNTNKFVDIKFKFNKKTDTIDKFDKSYVE